MGKKVDGALVQGFLYSGGQLVAELNSDDSVRSRFVYATRSHVPDYMVKGGVTYRFVTDELGSPRLVVNAATGVVVQELEYDEFGVVTADTDPGFQPFGYAGGLYDRDTKLVHFGAREYDPEVGRWTAKDPIGFAGGDTNLYGYVFSDPVNFIDPDGLSALNAVFGDEGFIDDVTPDAVSNAAAGALDSAWSTTVVARHTGDISHQFGIEDWCDAPGYGTGELIGSGGLRGIGKKLIKGGIRSFAKKVVAAHRGAHGAQAPAKHRRKEGERSGGREPYRKRPPGHRGPRPPR